MKLITLNLTENILNFLSPVISKSCNVKHFKDNNFDSLRKEVLSTKDAFLILLEPFQNIYLSKEFLHWQRLLSFDIPLLTILVFDKSNYSQATELYMKGAFDYIPIPSNIKVIQYKLDIAQKIIEEKLSSYEVMSVLERYSNHIDQVAEQRAKQLIHAERLATLGTITAGIAHEINNPLAYMKLSLSSAQKIIKNISTSFKEEKKDNTIEEELNKLQYSIERIVFGLNRISAIAGNLKNFGRNKEEKKPFLLSEAVENAIEIVEGVIKKNKNIIKNIECSNEVILGNSQEIEQVVINLLINANDAIAEKEDGIIRIIVDKLGNQARIIVEDNGPGIPEDEKEKIWKPFFTTKPEGKGSGLGLAIIKDIITKHKGKIKTEVSDFGGAKFIITLPFAPEKNLQLIKS